ncbi:MULTISPECIES: organic hydroperoxide resistance protein [Exiguobacterium]|uniref:organic hydroperoxide resistance protein n=1 Tax=Exiguobacterium TaxID=33986 RepID=UPI0009F348B2|nr:MULTISPECIES: organic hydroperoxide resistance protein [Exiguobacterium]TCI37657.1 organic hydroperoxide resistance protein [Exiguobacterium sp. SH4S7]TCI45991.1 organic hydroperoxide resistance protein [Exiguobacterium sp. SH5S32]TCI51748.1 organic hydroperoxide resistance protein [Exiguobacterium sp. SH1S4]TCI53796.1 organic hydroperoxide resistance protein [Exiguobacterium sp. SH1S21]TCI65765.1 organic hydroperoxide resistance protein [Exiguobacterium sp. SH0S2]
MKPLFTASATALGGREGRVTSTDGVIDLSVAMPGSKQAEESTNPEQLFAAGYAACFGSALNLVIGKERVKTDGTSVTGHVTLNQNDEGFFISVELEVEIKGVDQATAERLVEAAHQVCPYSKATRGNVDVKLTTNVA